MTALRPEHDAGQDGPYEHHAYEATGAFEAAVDQLADPLNDPLPGQHAAPWFRAESPPPEGAQAGAAQVGQMQTSQGPQEPQGAPREWYDPEGYERDWYGQQEPVAAPSPPPPPSNDETVGLRTADIRRSVAGAVASAPTTASAPPAVPPPRLEPEPDHVPEYGPVPEADGSVAAGPGPEIQGPEPLAEPPTGGRAERRRAAKGRGRRRAEPQQDSRPESASSDGRPLTRVEARRAARAAKDSPAVVASRVVGELFISLGVLMLLFVTYQLWWTNVRADQIAGNETHKIQDDWASGDDRKPVAFEPGQGFAIIHIPKLDVVAPIAEGTSKEKVLDRGMVGHYGEGALRTAMPSAAQGNFALAGHRNTHGEPFRYINRLRPGDPIVVETRDAYYTYEMTSVLPQTSPSNVSVIGPVPPGSGFTKPGRYITLTTCTPEFTSTYRLIVWGKMVDERPRSKGLPDVLVG
ncbi:class E sortase [Streptomyces sp. JH14]|uniref:class E sortase n=1 Tax=Streptomyces sp. JH14 TaxID=2793630 RepID=UPI0023F677DD|nr:class E sortase [Streptomyces sp. JH14]MDF6043627.1 class E sortase [Streptomyces sp. JH14]